MIYKFPLTVFESAPRFIGAYISMSLFPRMSFPIEALLFSNYLGRNSHYNTTSNHSSSFEVGQAEMYNSHSSFSSIDYSRTLISDFKFSQWI